MSTTLRLVLFLLVLIALLAFSVMTLDFRLMSWSLTSMGEFFAPFLAPDLSPDFLRTVAQAAWQTVAMAVVATVVSAGFAMLLAYVADRGQRWALMLVFNVLRTIPELLFASVLVLVAGLGPTAGVMALILHTTGVLSRLFVSALNNTDRSSAQALRLSGATQAQAFCFGLLPAVKTQWLSYTLYRSEMNIRAAAILGLVGAGGLGQHLHVALSLFHYHKASTLIITTLLLVIAAESISRYVRRNRFSSAQID